MRQEMRQQNQTCKKDNILLVLSRQRGRNCSAKWVFDCEASGPNAGLHSREYSLRELLCSQKLERKEELMQTYILELQTKLEDIWGRDLSPPFALSLSCFSFLPFSLFIYNRMATTLGKRINTFKTTFKLFLCGVIQNIVIILNV